MKTEDYIKVGTVKAKLQLFLYDLMNEYHLTFDETMLVLAECQRSTIHAKFREEVEREHIDTRGQEDGGGS